MGNAIRAAVAATVGALALAGCSGMTQHEKNMAAGAAVGGVAGHVVTGGSTAGTLAGAAVGGVVGHEVTKPSER